ncbi:hypothetical protein AURANDRAFT_65478 [Aureococcus anophagefferens]|uniref:Fibronectin type-III domain-containing protein n=1 Tax=Aureococcus anophagefferens TaxID=44056 RepID=F0YE25_AURAN|nr:hypothetical protein AURANDRAFT_65478 [Aureococcus anophagefferens]EGB06485.1 hypothetical protein AURANDRAFT_65478 [Aureococcus anophagefferens]|eukprot:XP_009038671.1 hypothetical protein AURANDRAFT_65478 [Aureococcus anophagefferens]
MVCSASADCTVRLFDALEGHLTYIFHGHASAVVSVAYSPTGRYIVSSSDYGERAIKLWDAAMPATASVTPVTMRVQWTTEGLISRFTLVKDPPKSLLEPPKKDQQDNHLGEKRQDPWDLLTDGEDEESEQERRAREKEERKKARDAERELRDASIQAAPDIKESGGFSLSLASVDRFGRVTQVDSYYGGVTLQVILRGVDPIAEFFVGGYGKDSVHDTFVKGSGARRGLFGRDLPLGTRHTCDKAAVNTRRFNARPEVELAWTAPPQGSGTLVATIIAVGLRVVKPNNGGKIISKLVVQRRELRPGGVKSEWANELGFPPAPGATGTPCDLTIEPLKPSVVYQFRVAAANANGTSGWSLPSFRSKTQDAEPPTKPGDPEVAKCYPKAADLTWAPADPRGSPVAGHVLELKRLRRAPPGAAAAGDDESDANDSDSGGSIDSDEARAPLVREVTRETAGAADGIVTTLEIGYRSTYHAENLEPTARYVFRVAACNGEGQGPWSAWSDSFATLQPAQPAPTAPRATQRRTNARGKSLFPGAARD